MRSAFPEKTRVTDANPGSARRRRAVFGRWPKTRERENRDFSREGLGDAASPKGLFGAPPNGTREGHDLMTWVTV